MIVGVLVGLLVGFIDGLLVGFMVGFMVGLSVGLVVGLSVGSLVGLLVGLSVGLLVGFTVGFFVGSFVGESVACERGVNVSELSLGFNPPAGASPNCNSIVFYPSHVFRSPNIMVLGNAPSSGERVFPSSTFNS